MKTFRIYPTSINTRYITECADALKAGRLIIYPTDTLYAIGCDALNQAAIERLCQLKGINPQKNTLSVICSDISQASEYAKIDNRAFALLRHNTPGPFTFILPSATTLPKAFKGRRQVGLRIPANEIALALAAELGHPLLTTSIPTDGLDLNEIELPDEILLRYNSNPDIDLMIDGGPGLAEPSTVVDLTDSSSPEIIRQGSGVLD
ncbi:MAG: L-threonylcarbamoyladenylate synthase [Firmicutes bacterium]|nr:L-threonylcarbamoyladenylate synthase [Bacillota bacterium]MCM1400886.1 L-threonylcarbamoyladenylate synthase [Bacteroides sp.]MCM1476280.1 L-threonylcarbamoyladenylate synthase [Bacteroides sp.]